MVESKAVTLSPDARAMILESLSVGCDLPVAARGAGVSLDAVRAAMMEDSEEGMAFLTAVTAAREEGTAARSGSEIGWHDVARASAPAVEIVQAFTPPASVFPTSALTSEDAARWAKVRQEAAAIAPGRLGTLLWIDARCQRAGLRALDAWWIWHFADYYESGKRIDKMRGGLRLGKSSTACEALVNTLAKGHELDAGTVAIIPIMSVRREEADDRFYTLVKILSACGMEPKKPDERTGVVLPNGFGGTYNHARNALSGGGQIRLRDSQGHDVEIRCFPARLGATLGPTCFSFFCDEVDGWPDDEELHANPAPQIVDGLVERTTTQPETEAFIFSANYRGADTYHAKLIDKGDTREEYCAVLGEIGAERDTEARLRLAELIKSTDARLLTPASPYSRDIPAWVGNPKASIETCFGLAHEDIGRMLGRYGGRATENKPRDDGGVERQCLAMDRMNTAIREGTGGRGARTGEPMKVAGARPGDARYAGPPSGGRRGLGGVGSWKTRRGL